jgi:hypothetical protein
LSRAFISHDYAFPTKANPGPKCNLRTGIVKLWAIN